ncbi:MAG: hypothetical protein NTX79_00645 [Candidatus Micrarchaeota archaeon]|nr:hypothetical protein [Candidatus Micrarchaeota archaeon]
MSYVQAFAKNVKTAVVYAREAFFNAKKDGFEYRLPLKSLLPQYRVREVAVSALAIGNREFQKVTYHEQEPVRGARARV